MKLYHGSNLAVPNPQILNSDRKLDFGIGFYLSSSIEQTKRWAELTTERRHEGKPTISVYEFDEAALAKLNLYSRKIFEEAALSLDCQVFVKKRSFTWKVKRGFFANTWQLMDNADYQNRFHGFRLKLLRFEKANKKWLDFVVANQGNTIVNQKWDIVIGPVANDRTMPVIRLFLARVYTAAEALRRLLPQQLHDQYTFKTEEALSYLKFERTIEK